MEQRRGPWYLFTGLILGAAAGLIYAWLISPVRYIETAPSSLRADFKDNYRSMIAAAYAADGDIGRAESRLTYLGDSDPRLALTNQAQQVIAKGGSQSEAEALARLAAAIAQQKQVTTQTPQRSQTSLITPADTSAGLIETGGVTQNPSTGTMTMTAAFADVSQANSSTPQPKPNYTLTTGGQTSTISATSTSTPTPGNPFVLNERKQVCDQAQTEPLLQVQLNDAAGNPVAGVEIHVSWQNNEDTFFTGLMPDINPGYADFQMTPGIAYTLHLGDGGQPVSNLNAVSCTASGGKTYWGGWYILMQQP